jgi:hypothetical protein
MQHHLSYYWQIFYYKQESYVESAAAYLTYLETFIQSMRNYLMLYIELPSPILSKYQIHLTVILQPAFEAIKYFQELK